MPGAAMTQADKGDAENGKEKGGEKEKEQRGVKRPIVPALVPESLQEVRAPGRGGSPPVPGDAGPTACRALPLFLPRGSGLYLLQGDGGYFECKGKETPFGRSLSTLVPVLKLILIISKK